MRLPGIRKDAAGLPYVADPALFVGSAIVGGLVLGGALIAAVLIGGQTFGQRCAKVYDRESPQWEQCVDRLAAGGRP